MPLSVEIDDSYYPTLQRLFLEKLKIWEVDMLVDSKALDGMAKELTTIVGLHNDAQ